VSKYAAGTTVSSSDSRAEIERTLERYGATSFAYGWDGDRAMIGFHMRDRQIRFVLPMPDRKSREFTHTPARGTLRSDTAAAAEYERAVKQRWRALALVVKAKLEAVESGIVTFEEEFGMHMVLPSGATVASQVVPAIAESYLTGKVSPLLALEQ
jgi:hypothetical protein